MISIYGKSDAEVIVEKQEEVILPNEEEIIVTKEETGFL